LTNHANFSIKINNGYKNNFLFFLRIKEVIMDFTRKYQKDLMDSKARRTVSSLGFVCSGASRAVSGVHKASESCEGGCGGQCLSGCKDECITVSK
jgi:hypothetical protein